MRAIASPSPPLRQSRGSLAIELSNAPTWRADIPRHIHFCDKTSARLTEPRRARWLQLNPNFLLSLHEDAECAAWMARRFGGDVGELYRALPGPIKANLWRVAYLHEFGGVYADVDVEPVLGLERVLDADDSFVTSGSAFARAVNPILIVARPREPLLNRTLARMLRYYRAHPINYARYSICLQMWEEMDESWSTRM